MQLLQRHLCKVQHVVTIVCRSCFDVTMTIQVVCVINLTSTKTREDKNAEQSLEARKAAYAEVEKACTWYVLRYENVKCS